MRAQVRYRLEKAREIEGRAGARRRALRRNRGGRPRRALPSHPPPATDGEAGPEVSIGVPGAAVFEPGAVDRSAARGRVSDAPDFRMPSTTTISC